MRCAQAGRTSWPTLQSSSRPVGALGDAHISDLKRLLCSADVAGRHPEACEMQLVWEKGGRSLWDAPPSHHGWGSEDPGPSECLAASWASLPTRGERGKRRGGAGGRNLASGGGGEGGPVRKAARRLSRRRPPREGRAVGERRRRDKQREAGRRDRDARSSSRAPSRRAAHDVAWSGRGKAPPPRAQVPPLPKAARMGAAPGVPGRLGRAGAI